MGEPFRFLDDEVDDVTGDDAFEDGGVVSSSTMTIGRLGPPV